MQNFLWRGQSLKVPREGQSSILIQDCWMNEFQKKSTGSGESSERWAPTSSTGRLLVTRYTIPNQDPAASDFSNRTGFALNPRRGDCWVSRNEYTPHYLYVRNLHSQVRHLVNTCSFQKSKYSFALNPRRRVTGEWVVWKSLCWSSKLGEERNISGIFYYFYMVFQHTGCDINGHIILFHRKQLP